ncbi:yippee-domain-containing protein [Xylaria venustula]|nr:yippee-domain-containing protein [Xylaria venustula]
MLSMVLNEAAPPPPPDPAAVASSPPRFPTYLLPSFPRPFRRHRRISSTTSNTVPAPSDVPSLSNSPTDSVLSNSVDSTPASSPRSSWLSHVKGGLGRLSAEQRDTPKFTRTQPDTIRCSICGTDFAFYSQVVSKGFTGRFGRAYLVSPPGGSSFSQRADADLMNIKVGKPENRLLVTGAHVVADIQCATCHAKIGWKYVEAKEESQKYKIGKFILETHRTVDHASWEDVMADELPQLDFEQEPTYAENNKDGDGADPVVFDSGDEDECEDLFAGIWDAKIAELRRKLKANARRSR